MREYYNKVVKIIYDTAHGTIAFVIKTADEQDFWYWYLNDDIVYYYFKTKGVQIRKGRLTRKQANRFCNDWECSDKGVSVGGFNTIEEAIQDITR